MADKENRSSYHPQKKSVVLRVFVLVVAILMTLGVVAVPFLYSGIF